MNRPTSDRSGVISLLALGAIVLGSCSQQQPTATTSPGASPATSPAASPVQPSPGASPVQPSPANTQAAKPTGSQTSTARPKPATSTRPKPVNPGPGVNPPTDPAPPTTNESDFSDFRILANENRQVEIRNLNSFNGTNGTGDVSLSTCRLDGTGCFNLQGGTVTCRDGSCFTTWNDSGHTIVLEQSIDGDPSKPTTLTITEDGQGVVSTEVFQ